MPIHDRRSHVIKIIIKLLVLLVILTFGLHAYEAKGWSDGISIETKNDNIIFYEKITDVRLYRKKKVSYFKWNINNVGEVNSKKEIGFIKQEESNKLYHLDNEYYLAVGYDNNRSLGQAHIGSAVLVDKNGKTIWKVSMGKGKSYAEAMAQSKDGGYVIVGHDFLFTSEMQGNYNAMIVKVNKHGEKEWIKHYMTDKSMTRAMDITKSIDGGYVVIAETSRNGIWVFKLDSKGKMIWEHSFKHQDMNILPGCINNDGSDGFIIANYKKGYGATGKQFWVISLDSNGKKFKEVTTSELEKGYIPETINANEDGSFTMTTINPFIQPSQLKIMHINQSGQITQIK